MSSVTVENAGEGAIRKYLGGSHPVVFVGGRPTLVVIGDERAEWGKVAGDLVKAFMDLCEDVECPAEERKAISGALAEGGLMRLVALAMKFHVEQAGGENTD